MGISKGLGGLGAGLLGGLNPMGILGIGLGVAGLGGDIFNSYLAWKNYKNQEAQFSYEQWLQNMMFNREDNSVQRRVADLKAAGLSPVLASGQSAGSGPVVSTKAPQMEAIPNTALNLMSLLKMKNDIQVTEAQKDLISMQTSLAGANASIKWHDYEVYKQTGQASNATGLAKALRDAFTTFNSPAINNVKNDLGKKVKSIDETLKPQGDKSKYNSPYDQSSDWSRIKKDLNIIFGGHK